MKRRILVIALFIAFSTQAQLIPNFGGERAGLSALSFLKNDISPRSLGMAGASTALNGDGYSILQNPAGMYELEGQAWTLTNSFLGAGINQAFISAIFPLKNKTSAIGASINTLTTGAIEERTEFQPFGTGRLVYGTNMAVAASYSQQLSDQFSLGVTLKYVYENLADFTNHTITTDVGFLYKLDVRDLQFAVLLKNFGGNSNLSGSFLASSFNRSTVANLEKNTLPNVFSIGVSITAWENEHHHLLGAFQLNHPNDNSENYRLGLEYDYLKLLFVRGGLKMNVKGQAYPTMGVGVKTNIGAHSLFIDYATNPTEYLGWQHLIGLNFNINRMER
jgi:hypothetical protein